MKFVETWKNRGEEKSDSQKFWLDLLRELFEKDSSIIEFERKVRIGDQFFYIDALIDDGRILVEQKSHDQNLERANKSRLTPFAQASQYFTALTLETHKSPDWIVLCNFQKFLIFDMRLGFDSTTHENRSYVREIWLEDLPEQWEKLKFLVDRESAENLHRENISVTCATELRLIPQFFNRTQLTAIEFDSLNRLCERLVFCLYADGAGIFPENLLETFLLALNKSENVSEALRRGLKRLFRILNAPKENRGEFVDETLDRFPYVNGELFSGDHLEILNDSLSNSDARTILETLILISRKFLWQKISPPIFGSIFEQIISEDNSRRSGGIHYTSVANIHKVIDPLFLDELNQEFENGDLKKLHDKIANLKFLDPACGSGNFLTETYISLRKLEDRIIEKIGGEIRVSIGNFYGIEISPFAVRIAKTALWISESQMSGNENFLPLKTNPKIVCGNALEIDWRSIVPDADYIIGNPPFIGHQYRSEDQIADMNRVFGDFPRAGKLDYVCAWFQKATLYMVDSKTESGFVSTNSICQGESVGILWKKLFEDGIRINFAWSSFKWENENADKKNMAHVHCVIIGFARFDRKIKTIDGVEVSRINGYLMNAPNVFIQNRGKMLTPRFPSMTKGSQITDGGSLIIESEDLESFLKKDPRAKKFIRKYIMGREFLYNLPRYCLWLVDSEPSERRSIKNIAERLEACRNFRLSSKTQSVRDMAKTPWLFTQNRQPSSGKILLVPNVSSEKREYLPIGFVDSETIVGIIQMIPDATLELFGILSSRIHMAWTRIVCGRLETRLSYTPSVYHNFPFPNHDKKIEETAQEILDARKKYPDSSLADLYDPKNMPRDLREAHKKNDLAVLDSYGFPHDITDTEIVTRLFEMYQTLTTTPR